MLSFQLRRCSLETNNKSLSSVVYKAKLTAGIIMVLPLGLSILLNVLLANALH
jgi:hypothetical protein